MKNENSQNSVSDGISAGSVPNGKVASSKRYAMLANMGEDDDVEDNN